MGWVEEGSRQDLEASSIGRFHDLWLPRTLGLSHRPFCSPFCGLAFHLTDHEGFARRFTDASELRSSGSNERSKNHDTSVSDQLLRSIELLLRFGVFARTCGRP